VYFLRGFYIHYQLCLKIHAARQAFIATNCDQNVFIIVIAVGCDESLPGGPVFLTYSLVGQTKE